MSMKEILNQLNIKVDMIEEKHIGNISRYYLKLLPGESLNKIEKKSMELALSVKSYGKPIIYPISHQGIVVLDFITKPQQTVDFCSFDFNISNKLNIPIILGRTQDGQDLVIDLVDAPHALVAGTTGSGKSVLLNSIICSILQSEKDIKLALVDPKRVEFSLYRDVKQLMYPVVNSSEEAQDIIEDLILEMNRRFKCMAEDDVNNISEYKNKKFPHIVMIIDEFSDLSLNSKSEFNNSLCLLAQKSRACGIHLVIATQRPSASIINGNIKSNFPTKIVFRTASITDSRVVIDNIDAHKLTGKGDGLIISEKYNLLRFKGAYIKKEDAENIVIKNNISLKTKAFRYIRNWI